MIPLISSGPSRLPLITGPASLHERTTRSLATEFWNLLDCDQRNQILWDLPDDKHPSKEDAFHLAIASSPFACFGCDPQGYPFACAWLSPSGQHSKTCGCHFAFAGSLTPLQQLKAGQDFISQTSHFADMLLAVIPIHWRGARNFAKTLGFTHNLYLPKACYIARFNRNIDGELLMLKLK